MIILNHLNELNGNTLLLISSYNTAFSKKGKCRHKGKNQLDTIL